MRTPVARAMPRGDPEPAWRDQAACRHADPELFFPDSHTAATRAQTVAAKQVCRRCPVTVTCLTWALANGQEFGIWGGTTEHERHLLQRRLRAPGWSP